MSSHESDENKGAVLYTGPDGIGNFNVQITDPFYTGVGTSSRESTLGADFICKGYSSQPFPLDKGKSVGDIGWGVSQLANYNTQAGGHQMKRAEFRQAAEDRYTHRLQNPFYDAKNSITPNYIDVKSSSTKYTPPRTVTSYGQRSSIGEGQLMDSNKKPNIGLQSISTDSKSSVGSTDKNTPIKIS